VLSAEPENALEESQSTSQYSRESGTILNYFEALVRAAGVSGRVVCGFYSNLHVAEALYIIE